MSKFGWCMSGHHPQCPVEHFKVLASDGKTPPRQTEEIVTCSCTCHTKGTNR